jgi:hypothetical protein
MYKHRCTGPHCFVGFFFFWHSKPIKIWNNSIYRITLEVLLGVSVVKKFHAESHVTYVTPVHGFQHTTHRFCGLDFFAVGGILLIKCIFLRRNTVFWRMSTRHFAFYSICIFYKKSVPQLPEFWLDNWSIHLKSYIIHVVSRFLVVTDFNLEAALVRKCLRRIDFSFDQYSGQNTVSI